MKLFLGTSVFIVIVATLFFACGPESSGEKPTTVTENDLKVEASCITESVGICINHVRYPPDSDENEIRELCEEDGVWSTKACSFEDVFGQCEFAYEGGIIIAYYFQPQSASVAKENCIRDYDGDYTAR